MERRHKTVPLASGNLQGLGRAMVTVMQRCHRGTAWGHCHLQQNSRVLLLPVGRDDAQPSITKGSDGSSLASSAAKTRGNQELLLLLRFSATCPHSVQDLAPVGMHPCIPSKTSANAPPGANSHPPGTQGHLQAAPCPQSRNPRHPQAVLQVLVLSSPSPAAAAARSAPAALARCLHLKLGEAFGDLSQ